MIYVFCAIQLVLWVITLIATYKMDEMIKDQEKLIGVYRSYTVCLEENKESLLRLIESQNSLIDSLKSQVMTYQFLENRREDEARGNDKEAVTAEGHCEENSLKPIEPAAVDMLIAAGALVVHGAIDKLQISAEGSTITIAVGSKGQVKVTRKETRGISAEC